MATSNCNDGASLPKMLPIHNDHSIIQFFQLDHDLFVVLDQLQQALARLTFDCIGERDRRKEAIADVPNSWKSEFLVAESLDCLRSGAADLRNDAISGNLL